MTSAHDRAFAPTLSAALRGLSEPGGFAPVLRTESDPASLVARTLRSLEAARPAPERRLPGR